MNITRLGIDLAKQVFQFHGVARHGNVLVRKQLRRAQMLASRIRIKWAWLAIKNER